MILFSVIQEHPFIHSHAGGGTLSGSSAAEVENLKKRFCIRIDTDQRTSQTIRSCEELGSFLDQHLISKGFVLRLQIAMQSPHGRIYWVTPASSDSYVLSWDDTAHSSVELWNILQQYLHIQVVEFKEKIYTPPDIGLGCQEHNSLFCPF